MLPDLIETPRDLADLLALDALTGDPPFCAIDTEADSLHRYRESLCLIQFAAAEHCVLIDPLAVRDLAPLGDFLSRAVVWMHGADYDMTMLKRQFGTLPFAVYDTQIGARLLGARKFGLADLVKEYFEVDLSKSSQKADWGKRPLSPKMVEYALNDVRYLLPMSEMITRRLRDKGRLDWFLESCEAAKAKVLERGDENREDLWRLKGSGRMDPKALACLRALWDWRDTEAKKWDRPSFMVATNSQLIEWSERLAKDQDIPLPKHFRSDRLKRFHQMRDTLAALPESEWPPRIKTVRRKQDRDFERKVDSLIALRDKAAGELDIEGSLIVSRSVIEALAAGEARPDAVLLKWQREILCLPDWADAT